jgi:hypothetical protein
MIVAVKTSPTERFVRPSFLRRRVRSFHSEVFVFMDLLSDLVIK